MPKTLLMLLLSWLPALLLAQTPNSASTPPGSAAAVPAEAVLVYFNRPVFTFRSSFTGISAADRARRAHARIHDLLELPGPHQVTLRPDVAGLLLQIDGATALVASAADLNPALEDNLQQAAQRAAAALTQAIAENHEARNLERLLQAAAQAGLATVLTGLLAWLATRARAAAAKRLLAVADQHAPTLRLGGLTIFQRERWSGAIGLWLTALHRVLLLLLLVEWLSYVLQSFPFTRAWGESIHAFLLTLVLRLLTAVIESVPGLLMALVIFYLAHLATQALRRFFDRVQSGKIKLDWLDADVVLPTQRIAKVVLWLFALAMAYPYLPGAQTEAFKGLSVLVGLMLSLGASSLVGQLASGLILTYGRVLRKGEFVRIADHEGSVTELGMFTTRIRTGMGEEITLSNSSILAATTKNYSRAVQGVGFILDTTVTIGYDTPWRQVHEMLIQAAQRTPGVLADPAPQVFQTALNDWYPVYRLVCQAVPTEPRPRALLLSTLHAHIQDIFNAHGVQIMSPHYWQDPASPKLVAVPAVKPTPDAGVR